MSDEEYGGIDGLTRWLGLRWESHDRVRLTIRPELINPAGLLSGPVVYAMVDYSMGSALWAERERGERIATIGISINYLRTAREGDVFCVSRSTAETTASPCCARRSATRAIGCWRRRSAASRSSPPSGSVAHDHGPAAPESIEDAAIGSGDERQPDLILHALAPSHPCMTVDAALRAEGARVRARRPDSPGRTTRRSSASTATGRPPSPG